MNEKKLKYLTIGVFTLAVINIILVAMIFLGPKPPRKDKSMMRDKMEDRHGGQFLFKELNANKEQKEAFRTLFKAHRKRKDSIEMIIRKNKALLAGLAINSENITLDKDSLILEIGKLFMQNEEEMYDHFTEMKTICEPDQLEKLEKILQRSHKRRIKERE